MFMLHEFSDSMHMAVTSSRKPLGTFVATFLLVAHKLQLELPRQRAIKLDLRFIFDPNVKKTNTAHESKAHKHDHVEEQLLLHKAAVNLLGCLVSSSLKSLCRSGLLMSSLVGLVK